MANTNTLDVPAVTHKLQDTAIIALPALLAPLTGFTTDFSTEIYPNSRRIIGIPKLTAGTSVQTDATDFESGDTTTTEIQLATHHYSASFHITNAELLQGYRLQTKAKYHLNGLAQKVMSVVTTLMTTTSSFGTSDVGASGTFTGGDLAATTALVPSFDLTAILSAAYWAKVLPADRNGWQIVTEGGYGFNRIYKQTVFTGADANIVGFVADSRAIAIAAGVPETTTGIDLIDTRVIQLEALGGLPIQTNLWANTKSRALWASYDIVFGAAVMDATAGYLLIHEES